MIEIELFELKNICMQMAELGAAANEKSHFPATDEIKQREAHRLLKILGHRPGLLEKLVSEGLVHRRRKGSSSNSPVLYSKFEIQSALGAINIGKLIEQKQMGL